MVYPNKSTCIMRQGTVGRTKVHLLKNAAEVAGKALGEDAINIDGILATNNLVAVLILFHPIHEFLDPPPRSI